MNLRLIHSKYNSRCKRCSGRIRVGDFVYWSKETGAICRTCGDAGKAPTPNVPPNRTPEPTPDFSDLKLDRIQSGGKDGHWRIDWADLKQFAQKVWKENAIPKGFRAANERLLRSMLLDVRESWTGHSRGQAERWISEGYVTESLKGIQDFAPPLREKRRLQFTDDGDEFHLDLAYNGDENYMSS